MSSIRSDITLIRGDSRNINFTLTGVNLTGATVFFTAKPTLANEETDATAVIEAQTSVFDDPTNGKAVIVLTSILTDITPGDYYYDIQVKKQNGDIISIPARKLTVVADVTRRTS
jgi:hypothetical protein